MGAPIDDHYVLITPARDEADFIERTLQSVIHQTVRPMRWVVVSDGSTDQTDAIVQRYTKDHPWIALIRLAPRRERNFAGKVTAFNAGYTAVRDLPYTVIGSLDADISFEPGYFEYLLRKLAAEPALGVVGTPFQGRSMYDYRFVSIEHVSGACQLFRRACFEAIGGYVPVRTGGVDHIAVVTARMHGWQTRTFTDMVCRHHRELGTAKHHPLVARFKDGRQDYVLGAHPVWELFRAAYQMSQPPLVVRGAMLLSGYAWAAIRRSSRPVSRDFVRFRRQEQMRRLRRFLLAHGGSQPGDAAAGRAA
jgi:hypothetical protein